MDSIRIVDLSKIDLKQFSACLADCVILTRDNKILMQKRPKNWHTQAGALNIFGGHVETSETVVLGLVRELREELGAVVKPEDVTFIGAITEDWTNHTEIVHVHFWHDKEFSITGCYEAEAVEFDTVEQALAQPKLMDYAAWALKSCRNKELI